MMLTDPLSSAHDFAQIADSVSLARQVRAYISYERWFGTACWFVLLGPVGALFYRCTALIADASVSGATETYSEGFAGDEDQISSSARSLLGWMDWVPVRLWACCLLLVGDFSKGFSSFRRYWLEPFSHAVFLDRVSLAAAGCAPESIDNECISEDQILRDKLLELSDRAMVVGLLMLLLLVIL